jgi:hypothetical protein
MAHTDRQPKADARVCERCLVVLAWLALTGADSSAAQKGGAAGAPVLATPVWTPAPPSAPAGAAPSSPPTTPGGWPRLRIADPVGRHAARNALDLAWERLARADCARVASAFTDHAGHSLDDRLRALAMDLQTYLTMVVFIDGSRESPCVTGVFGFTVPGHRVVRICIDELKRTWQQDPEHTAASFIHEMLHTLGLGENPPSPAEITRLVLAGCRRGR